MSALAWAIIGLSLASGIAKSAEDKRLGRRIADYSAGYIALAVLLELTVYALAVLVLVNG